MFGNHNASDIAKGDSLHRGREPSRKEPVPQQRGGVLCHMGSRSLGDHPLPSGIAGDCLSLQSGPNHAAWGCVQHPLGGRLWPRVSRTQIPAQGPHQRPGLHLEKVCGGLRCQTQCFCIHSYSPSWPEAPNPKSNGDQPPVPHQCAPSPSPEEGSTTSAHPALLDRTPIQSPGEVCQLRTAAGEAIPATRSL